MGALPEARIDIASFFRWWDQQGGEERYELVDGQIVAMGRDRVRHNLAKIRAVNALALAVRAADVDCIALTDGIGVSPDKVNYRLPDALVNCGPVDPDDSVAPNPVVVMEIVSPSSAGRDRHEKLRDYFAIASVAHYLIVYEDRGYVVHHKRSQGDVIVTTFVNSGRIALDPPGISIDAEALLGGTN